MAVPRSATIEDLPNEILNQLLSVVLDDLDHDYGMVEFQDKDGRSRKLPQLFVLRSVSRRFRYITNHADFWLKKNFTFWNLAPDNQINLAKALLADSDLASALSRKTHWFFNHLSVWSEFVEHLPMFGTTTRAIYFDFYGDDVVGLALPTLIDFPLLTTLILVNPLTEIDLDIISSACPFLQTLKVIRLSIYVGTVLQLAFLETLSYGFEDSWAVDFLNFDPPRLNSALLPLGSAQSLKALSIANLRAGPITTNNGNPLDLFPNLDELKFENVHGPGSNDLFLIIKRARNIQLSTFTVELELSENVQNFSEMLSSPIFARLNEFTLAVHTYGLYRYSGGQRVTEILGSYVEAVTTHLHSVRRVVFGMTLDLSWRHFFSSVKNLRQLVWWTNRDLRLDVDVDGDGDGTDIAKKAFERTFSNFVEMPEVEVKLGCWWNERGALW